MNVYLAGLGNKRGYSRGRNTIKSFEDQMEELKFGVVDHRELQKTFE